MNRSKNIIWTPSEYAEAAVVAHEAGEEMLTRLSWMTIKPKIILDIGCGIGKDAMELGKRYPDATVVAIDHSLPMIEYAKKTTSMDTVISAEGDRLPLRDKSVDLIFANFFLSWQHNVKTILSEWLRVLSPNGLLIVTALGLNTLQEIREAISTQHLPECVDMHDVGDALLQAGFADPVLDVDYYTVTYQNKMRLVHELQASGLWFPENEADMQHINSVTSNVAGVWPITYEIIYAHAFAPVESADYSPAEDGTVKIPLAHLRRRLAV